MDGRFASTITAFGLTERQSGLLLALVQAGSLNGAVAATGMSYTAARNLLAELKTKFGVPTVPMLIGLALDLMAVDFDSRLEQERRHDLFSLTERQLAIARAVSVCPTRREIADAVGCSPAVVDGAIKDIYLVLGVRSAGELTRVVDAAMHPGEHPADADAEAHLHDLPHSELRTATRRIGYSDYGPAGAPPVVILHSTVSSRAPPTRLVEALRAAGMRPIAIDRPGFGDTDPAPASEEPYVQAAADLGDLSRALGLAQIDIVARGCGQAGLRMGQLQPALVRRAVLVNPTPSFACTPVDRGPLGAVKRAFGRWPWAVGTMIPLLAAYATSSRLHAGMLRSFRASPPDLALVRDDPRFTADYLRAVRGFAAGLVAGYVAEQTAWASGYDVDPLPGLAHWRIVQGRHFVLHEPRAALTYWREKLPDTPVQWIEDAGQMLAYSHPQAVVRALLD